MQDWFHALLLGRYVGYGYAIWVGAVFSTLIDWVFNKGRVTRAILDAVGSLASST